MRTNALPTFTYATMRLGARMAVVLACFAFGSGVASAECSQRARMAGKCPPPPHVQPKSKFVGPVAGTTPLTTTSHAQPVTKMRRTSPVPGPSPIEHKSAVSDRALEKSALNPQPIPPGRPLHPLPPAEGGGH